MVIHVCPTCRSLSLSVAGWRGLRCDPCSTERRLLTPEEVQSIAQLLLTRPKRSADGDGARAGSGSGRAAHAKALREYGRELRHQSEALRARCRALRGDDGHPTSAFLSPEPAAESENPADD